MPLSLIAVVSFPMARSSRSSQRSSTTPWSSGESIELTGVRNKLRQKYVLPPRPCGDCLMHCACLCCSIAQEIRELKNRGWDPKRGTLSHLVTGLAPVSWILCYLMRF
ncbi:unnamed protein product [Closterium sp. NIES-54]